VARVLRADVGGSVRVCLRFHRGGCALRSVSTGDHPCLALDDPLTFGLCMHSRRAPQHHSSGRRGRAQYRPPACLPPPPLLLLTPTQRPSPAHAAHDSAPPPCMLPRTRPPLQPVPPIGSRPPLVGRGVPVREHATPPTVLPRVSWTTRTASCPPAPPPSANAHAASAPQSPRHDHCQCRVLQDGTSCISRPGAALGASRALPSELLPVHA